METQIVREGNVKLEVPELEKYQTSPKEYIPSKTPVFFNPVMELTRDISVSSVQVACDNIRGLRICDALAGVGARGVRYAEEIREVGKVLVNDRLHEAAELIRKNIELNKTENATASEEDTNVLLHNHRPRFHVIDLDPFGTPIPFLESSFSAISRRGMLLVTATDTAPLCGAYPKPCQRKYGATPLRITYSREIGLRILIGAVQRKAAAYDLALEPLLSHATQHYFRVHFDVSQGAKVSNNILKKNGYISHCTECGKRYTKRGMIPDLPKRCDCGEELQHAGPLWLGKLSDKKHLKAVKEDLPSRKFELINKEMKLINTCLDEVDGPPAFYDIHEISSKEGTSPPKLEKLIDKIQTRGFFASRTHFSGTGIRTNAPLKILKKLVSK